MKNRKSPTVAVAINIGGASGRDCLAGIFRFLNEGNNWHIQLFDNPQKLTPSAIAKADGVITESDAPEDVLRALRKLSIPTILTDYHSDTIPRSPNFGLLRLDDTKIGEAAYDFFARLGSFGSFAFVTDSAGTKWSDARRDGFLSAARHAGKSAFSLDIPSDDSNSREIQAMAIKLARLTKPVAIFSAWDKLSMRMLELCEAGGIEIPHQAVILGVDNDEVICRGARIALSSILPDHESLGHTAARELGRLLRGGSPKDVTISNPVREIFERDSTNIVPPAEHLIRKAKAYISSHASESITPKDVVRYLGVSRSLADLRFRELNGSSIRKEIAVARIGTIKRRLTSSKNSLSEIAHRCGFSSCPALSRYFKRETGLSPSEWRER